MKNAARILMWLLLTSSTAYPAEWISVDSVTGDSLTYRRYIEQDIETITFPNIVLHERAAERTSVIYRRFYPNLEAVQAALLKHGLAKLKDPDAASSELRILEREARAADIGLWADENETQRPDNPASVIDWSKIAATVAAIVGVIITFGLASLLLSLLWRFGKWLHYRWFVARNVELLIIGRASAGKTAVMTRLVDPNATAERIAHLSPSTHTETTKRHKYIPIGKYHVWPIVTDVPGAKPGAFLDYVIGTKLQILIVVLAPTQAPTSTSQNSSDNNFIQSQIGYVEALVEGTLQSSRIAKPRLLIVFLNKFDLWSPHPPFDSAAETTRKEFEKLFSDHTRGIRTQAKLVKVKTEVVVGSALHGWGTERVTQLMGEMLHGL